MSDYLVDSKYERKLAEIKQKLEAKRIEYRKKTPELTPAAAIRIQGACSPALNRMMQYVMTHPGARSDEISAAVAIGNVSDAATSIPNRESQQRLGVMLTCEVLPGRNRFGQKTVIGHWWFDVVDPVKWERVNRSFDYAANDAGDQDAKGLAGQ